MYERHFRLSQRPFPPAPHADWYIATGTIEPARQTLVRLVERSEGPGLVIGPAGSGKSLLCQTLAKHFRGRLHVALLGNVRLATRRALLQNILFELKLPYRELDEGELRLSLVDHLERSSGASDGLLLIVDEAHALPLRLLEEIRLLTNVVQAGQSRVRLVLAGSLALEERLASPKLESFHQRIAARCYLQSLTRDETLGYVAEQIRRAGGVSEAIFTHEALKAIHTATDGIPRLINQVCDHALLLAALGGHAQLSAGGIEEAWADLQQLPAPWHEPVQPAATVSGGTIEFGQLRDEIEQPPVAGKIRPNLSDATVAHLAAIHHAVDALASDDPALGVISGTALDEFSPSVESNTEVDLIFHDAHDPFGSHWNEEEVVIDHYASLEDAALRNRQRATSDEGRSIGTAVAQALQSHPKVPPPTVSQSIRPFDEDELEDVPPVAALALTGTAFHPANDPLLPESSAHVERPRRATISLRELAGDDRDIIVVDDDASRPPVPLTGRPRRAEYRQLFSKLKNKA